MAFLRADWVSVFALETPIVELFMWGSVIYFAVLMLVPVMPRRITGGVANMDILLIILIADATGKAFGGYAAIADGVIFVVVIIGWDYSRLNT